MNENTHPTLNDIISLNIEELNERTHIIIGENGRCMCGIHNGNAMSCSQIIDMQRDYCKERIDLNRERLIRRLKQAEEICRHIYGDGKGREMYPPSSEWQGYAKEWAKLEEFVLGIDG